MFIPIHGPEKIFETKPDYVPILPRNLRKEISGKTLTTHALRIPFFILVVIELAIFGQFHSCIPGRGPRFRLAKRFGESLRPRPYNGTLVNTPGILWERQCYGRLNSSNLH